MVIDPHPVDPGRSTDALLIAQNTTQDPKSLHGEAIRKRPGLIQFNTVFAGGPILGGIQMPVAEFGGAPAAGGGAFIGTGDPSLGSGPGSSPGSGGGSGSGAGTGAAGATFNGGAIATTPSGAGLFNGGGTIFGGARIIIVGRIGGDQTVGQEGGSGWYVSSKSLNDVATSQTTPGPPISPYSFPPISPFADAWGTPSCIDANGTILYYATAYGNQVVGTGINRTIGTGPNGVTIHRLSGGSDQLLTTIPANTSSAAGVGGSTVLGVTGYGVATGGSGYTSGETDTFVGGTGTAATIQIDAAGSITISHLIGTGSYSVAPSNPVSVTGGTGSGGKLSAAFGSTTQRSAITSLHFGSDGNIYMTMKDKFDGQNVAGSVGRAFRVSPSTGSILEMNLLPFGANPGPFNFLPYSCAFFNSWMFTGTFPAAINETAIVRATDGNSETEDIGLGGADGSQHAMGACFALYNGRLFHGTGVWQTAASYAQIWSRRPGALQDGGAGAWTQLLPNPVTGGAAQNGNYIVSMVVFNGSLYASWFNPGLNASIFKITANSTDPTSTSFTVSSNTSLQHFPYYLFVDDGVMYAIAVQDASNTTIAYTTPDGVTWTEKSTSLPNFATSSRMRPVFFGVAQ